MAPQLRAVLDDRLFGVPDADGALGCGGDEVAEGRPGERGREGARLRGGRRGARRAGDRVVAVENGLLLGEEGGEGAGWQRGACAGRGHGGESCCVSIDR